MIDILISIIIGLVILVLLVVIHEFGHAFAARRSGVVVKEFGIGLPPRIFGKKTKSGMIFSLNWLMLGGFVRLKGEHNESKGPGSYGEASFLNKTKILWAGVLANFVLAGLLLSGLALFGLPKMVPDQFYIKEDARINYSPVELVAVNKQTPAQKAGLEVGDKIVDLDGKKITSQKQVTDYIRQKTKQPVQVTFLRKSHKQSVVVYPEAKDGYGYIGVGLAQSTSVKSTWSAPLVGFVTTAQLARDTLKGIIQLVGNVGKSLINRWNSNYTVRDQAKKSLSEAGQQVVGPLGIVAFIFPTMRQADFSQILLLMAVISVSLAVVNILPIPALDGGRWLTMAIYKVLGKELTKKQEEKIQTIGFMIITFLFIVVTILDVKKIF